jgi:hypothetical protein
VHHLAADGNATAARAGVRGGIAGLHNAPNPFRDATEVRFVLAEEGPVSVSVFDVGGRLVRETSIDATPGLQRIRLPARTDGGTSLGPGVYFYRVETGGTTSSGRMTVLR